MTHSVISDDAIEQAWQEVNTLAVDGRLALLMREFGDQQPKVADFIAEAAGRWSEDAADLAYHATLVIWTAFRKQGKPHKVSGEALIRHFELVSAWLDRQEGDEILLQKKLSELGRFREPELMRYVIEAVFEAHEDGLELEPSEQEQAFLTLATIVNALSDS